MTPLLQYRTRTASGWTRIDMLLALYSGLQRTVLEGHDRLQRGQLIELREQRARAYRRLLGLIEGIDLDQGEIPRNVLRLLLFVWDELSRDEPQAWVRSGQILEILRQGFAGIAEEARALERSGHVPALEG